MWHQFCWTNEYKERQQKKKGRQDQVSYNASADVQPEYYRVAEVADAPSSSSSGNSSKQTSAPAPAPSGRSCSACSRSGLGDECKFCPGCGNKL